MYLLENVLMVPTRRDDPPASFFPAFLISLFQPTYISWSLESFNLSNVEWYEELSKD